MDFQRKRLRIREVEMQKTFEFGNTEEGFGYCSEACISRCKK